MHHLNETAGTLTLMGSGVMSPGMAETHRRIMRLIESDVRPAFAAPRASKQYAQADQLRADLLAAGIELTDTPQGTLWLRTALEQKDS